MGISAEFLISNVSILIPTFPLPTSASVKETVSRVSAPRGLAGAGRRKARGATRGVWINAPMREQQEEEEEEEAWALPPPPPPPLFSASPSCPSFC